MYHKFSDTHRRGFRKHRYQASSISDAEVHWLVLVSQDA